MRPAFLLLLPLAALVGCAVDPSPPQLGPGEHGHGPVVVPIDVATVSLSYYVGSPAGQPVVFQGADGRVLATVDADANGDATGPIEAGGMVTFHMETDGDDLRTVAGVQVGDHIQYSENPPTGTPTLAGSITVTLPGAVTDGTTYGVFTGGGCQVSGDAGTAVVLRVFSNCLASDGTADVTAVAQSFSDVLAWAPLGHVAIGSTVTAPAWTRTWDPVPFAIDGLDAADHDVTVRPSVTWDGNSSLSTPAVDLPVTSGSAAGTFNLPAGLGDRENVTVGVDRGSPSLGIARYIVLDGALGAALHADGATLLPSITAAALAQPGPQPVASWTTVGTLDTADLLGVRIVTGAGNQYVQWTVIAPPTTTSIQLPELPDALAASRPTAQSKLGGVWMFDDAGRTWDDARADAGAYVAPVPGHRESWYSVGL